MQNTIFTCARGGKKHPVPLSLYELHTSTVHNEILRSHPVLENETEEFVWEIILCLFNTSAKRERDREFGSFNEISNRKIMVTQYGIIVLYSNDEITNDVELLAQQINRYSIYYINVHIIKYTYYMHLRLYSYNVNTVIRLASKRCFNNDNNNNNKYNNCVELFVCLFLYIYPEWNEEWFFYFIQLYSVFFITNRGNNASTLVILLSHLGCITLFTPEKRNITRY